MNLWLAIPELEIWFSILDVRLTNGSWDVSWLTNQAGYLENTGFPSLAGNIAVSGHVYLQMDCRDLSIAVSEVAEVLPGSPGI